MIVVNGSFNQSSLIILSNIYIYIYICVCVNCEPINNPRRAMIFSQGIFYIKKKKRSTKKIFNLKL